MTSLKKKVKKVKRYELGQLLSMIQALEARIQQLENRLSTAGLQF